MGWNGMMGGKNGRAAAKFDAPHHLGDEWGCFGRAAVLCAVQCAVQCVLDPHPSGKLRQAGAHAGEVSEHGGCVFPGPSALMSSEGANADPTPRNLRASLGRTGRLIDFQLARRPASSMARWADVRPLRHSLRIRSTKQHMAPLKPPAPTF